MTIEIDWGGAIFSTDSFLTTACVKKEQQTEVWRRWLLIGRTNACQGGPCTMGG